MSRVSNNMIMAYISNYMLFHKIDNSNEYEILKGIVFLLFDNEITSITWNSCIGLPVYDDKKLTVTITV